LLKPITAECIEHVFDTLSGQRNLIGMQGSVITLRPMMGLLTGAVGVVAIVLVVSGLAKVLTPSATTPVLADLRLPHSTIAVRGLGVVEVAIGTAALLVGSAILDVAVALLYLGFALVVVAARRAGTPSCGCFGANAAPPSTVHVAVNVCSAIVAVTAAVAGTAPVLDLISDQPAAGVPFGVLMGTAAWLVVGLDTAGADMIDQMAALRRSHVTSRAHASDSAGATRQTIPVRQGQT
jgi:hypothetical protein